MKMESLVLAQTLTTRGTHSKYTRVVCEVCYTFRGRKGRHTSWGGGKQGDKQVCPLYYLLQGKNIAMFW